MGKMYLYKAYFSMYEMVVLTKNLEAHTLGLSINYKATYASRHSKYYFNRVCTLFQI